MNTPFNTETYQILAVGLNDVSKPDLPTLHPTIHPAGHMRYHVDYVFLKGKKLVAEKSEVPVVDGSDHLPVIVNLITE
jgi:endonuclease/exonuclease/phosphatase (EEP) superfamily protein YafD